MCVASNDKWHRNGDQQTRLRFDMLGVSSRDRIQNEHTLSVFCLYILFYLNRFIMCVDSSIVSVMKWRID